MQAYWYVVRNYSGSYSNFFIRSEFKNTLEDSLRINGVTILSSCILDVDKEDLFNLEYSSYLINPNISIKNFKANIIISFVEETTKTKHLNLKRLEEKLNSELN